MPRTSKTPVETVEHYRGKTMRLLSCVTSVHVVSAYRLSDAPHELELAAKRHQTDEGGAAS
jgi:hypothetical protein